MIDATRTTESLASPPKPVADGDRRDRIEDEGGREISSPNPGADANDDPFQAFGEWSETNDRLAFAGC